MGKKRSRKGKGKELLKVPHEDPPNGPQQAL